MPETIPLQSAALSRRFAVLWPAIRRMTCGLCVVGLLLLPTITSAQTPPGEPNVGEAAPFGAEDLAKPPTPLAAEVNPPVIPTINDPIEAENVPEKPDVGHLIPTDPIELFLAGGFSMWPLLLASIISLWFVLERLVVLRRRRVIPRAFVDRFIQHLEQGKLNAETALRLCEENQSPIADIFAHGVRKWGKPSVEVEQAIIDGGERQISQLRTHLRVIHGVYNVAPMLGLLGTVVGMVVSFNELARGGDADRMQRLAGGVGVALITTATGLFVAIPSLVLYLYLSGRIDGLIIEMDLLSQKVANLISSEGLANRSKMNMAKATPTTTQALPGVPAPKPKAVGT